MKQQLIDRWLMPIVKSPKTTISAFGAVLILLLPHHSATIASAVAAIGLMFASDATSNPQQ